MDYYGILLSFLLGALIGLRYEVSVIKKGARPLGGFRSFGFLGLLGYFAGTLAKTSYILGPSSYILMAIVSALVVAIIIFHYRFELYKSERLAASLSSSARDLKQLLQVGQRYGIVTELSAILVYLAGFLIATAIVPQHFVVVSIVSVALMLIYQRKIRAALFKISDRQLKQLGILAVLTMAILPILPNRYYSIADILNTFGGINDVSFWSMFPEIIQNVAYLDLINPYKMWLYVILIIAVEFITYLVVKILKTKTGLAVSALAAGLVSSTGATVAYASRARDCSDKRALLGAIFLANAISFVDVFLILGAINVGYLFKVAKASVVFMLIFAGAGLLLLGRSQKMVKGAKYLADSAEGDRLFNLGFALKFGAFLAFVQIVTRVAYALAGHTGLIVVSALAGLGGINAILVTSAELVSVGAVSIYTGALIFFVVNAANFIAKFIYILIKGDKNMAIRFLGVATIALLSGVVVLI